RIRTARVAKYHLTHIKLRPYLPLTPVMVKFLNRESRPAPRREPARSSVSWMPCAAPSRQADRTQGRGLCRVKGRLAQGEQPKKEKSGRAPWRLKARLRSPAELAPVLPVEMVSPDRTAARQEHLRARSASCPDQCRGSRRV